MYSFPLRLEATAAKDAIQGDQREDRPDSTEAAAMATAVTVIAPSIAVAAAIVAVTACEPERQHNKANDQKYKNDRREEEEHVHGVLS